LYKHNEGIAVAIMGYQSSIAITREDCLKEIFGRLLKATNKDLCSTLDTLSRDNEDPLYFYNFYMVNIYEDDNRHEWFHEKDYRDI
jgi:hypothetical protein